MPSALPFPWQHWSLITHVFDGRELFIPRANLVVMHPDIASATHAVAHLELGHHEARGSITDAMEAWAVQLAFLLEDDGVTPAA